tara:strand:- start:174 stop:419 length:246 start_codon:yes stop_codon:yes gene_type:complete
MFVKITTGLSVPIAESKAIVALLVVPAQQVDADKFKAFVIAVASIVPLLISVNDISPSATTDNPELLAATHAGTPPLTVRT